MSAQRSILIVDDDPQLLRLMVRLVERAGHRVRTATSVADTLALFEDAAPGFDLLVLDVNLAPDSGAETLLPELSIRAPGLEVVLISGDALPASLERALAERGGRFLRKPFAPPALLRLVETSGGGAPGPRADPARRADV